MSVYVVEWARHVELRSHGSDQGTLDDVLRDRDYRPPEPITDARLILDLGANVGLTAIALAVEHPTATIIAVELDADNAALCAENTADLNVRTIHAGIWTYDGDEPYQPNHHGQNAHRLDPAGHATAPVRTIDTILADAGLADAAIDYIKMDIEGAERAVLEHGGAWVARTRQLKVEHHEPHPGWAIEALVNRHWHAAIDAHHPRCINGVRAG